MKKALLSVLLVLSAGAAPRAAAVGLPLYIPSSAHAPGANGAFYTTDLAVSNPTAAAVTVTLTFLGHDQDGTGGPQQTFSLGAGQTRTFTDVLGTVFGVTNGYGAIRIVATSTAVIATAQTSTPGFGGTFGQSLPASSSAAGPLSGSALIQAGAARSIGGVREDAAFRTNLVLLNVTGSALDVDVALYGAEGSALGTKRYTLPPLGMTQVSRVVRDIGVSGATAGARVDLSTPTSSGAFAAYASAIDNVTNDPRTLLPTRALDNAPFGWNFFLPSSARAAGANGAFYTTDLTISNLGATPSSGFLQFLGHDQNGTSTPQIPFTLAAGRTVTYADVLASVFGQTSGYGAIRVYSDFHQPNLLVLGQTSTPGFGGSFGQSVPAEAEHYTGSISFPPLSILGVREDSAFRTNLILCNGEVVVLDLDVALVDAGGATLATRRYSLLPLEMIQVTRVVRDLGVAGDLAGARLVLSSNTSGGGYLAYASVIDNVTNDPRTLLPR